MTAQLFLLRDYQRPAREPPADGESASVVILPVIRIERHAPAFGPETMALLGQKQTAEHQFFDWGANLRLALAGGPTGKPKKPKKR